MSLDIGQMLVAQKVERTIAPGSAFYDDGACAIFVTVAGVEYVQPCTGLGGENYAGFVNLASTGRRTRPQQENLTIPGAPGPYTVTTKFGSIFGTGPAGYEVEVYDVTAAGWMAQNAGIGAGQFAVTSAAGGILSFNALQAGHSIRVRYRYNLTMDQVIQDPYYVGVRHINNEATNDQLNQVSVLCAWIEIGTDFYATATTAGVAIQWAVGDTLKTGFDGRIENQAGAGTAIANSAVTGIPTVDNPYLYIRVKL